MQENQKIMNDQTENPNLQSEGLPEMEGLDELVQENANQEIEVLQAKVTEYYDALLRAKADADNAYKRHLDEVAKARKFAIERFAEGLLPVADSLHAALSDQTADLDKVRVGVELTLKQLAQALEKGQVVEVSPQGEKFDPNLHQAIGTIPATEESQSDTVAQVLQRGYTISDRVLRPALVMVYQ